MTKVSKDDIDLCYEKWAIVSKRTAITLSDSHFDGWKVCFLVVNYSWHIYKPGEILWVREASFVVGYSLFEEL